MQGKKGLIAAAVALVAVLVAAGAAYGMLGQGANTVPNLSGAASSEGEPEGAGSDVSSDADGASGTSTGQDATGSVAAGTEASGAEASTDTSEAPLQFADFAVEDLNGNKVNLSSVYGKPALLIFWATWCPPCNTEAPTLQKLYDTYGDRVNFMMIDSASDGRDTPEVVRTWLDENGYTYPVYIDLSGEAASECQIYYLPTTIVLDASGTVLTGFSGAMDEETGTDLVEQLLAM